MPIAIVIWRNPPPRHATPKGVRLVSWSSTDQAGAATAAARQSMLIVDAGRDVETPAAAAAVTFFSSLIEEKVTPIFVSTGPFKFTSRARPHSRTANLRARPCLFLGELSLRSIALSWFSMSMSLFQKGNLIRKLAMDGRAMVKTTGLEAS